VAIDLEAPLGPLSGNRPRQCAWRRGGRNRFGNFATRPDNLAVALQRVTVAKIELRARMEDRQIDGRAFANI